jgi:Holliday junction resolvasome RuvABC endonuclease subunit
MKSFVLGLDISTTCVGWAMLSLNYAEDKDLRYGKIIPAARVSWFQRADHIYAEMGRLVETVPICAIAIEELNSMRGGETTRQLAGINMGVQYLLYRRFGITPSMMWMSSMKKGFTGSGSAKKWDMIARANELYGLDLHWPLTAAGRRNKKVNDEDVADAIGAAYCLEQEVGDELRATLKEVNDVR